MAQLSFYVAVDLRANSPFSFLWTALTTSGLKHSRWVLCFWILLLSVHGYCEMPFLQIKMNLIIVLITDACDYNHHLQM